MKRLNIEIIGCNGDQCILSRYFVLPYDDDKFNEYVDRLESRLNQAITDGTNNFRVSVGKVTPIDVRKEKASREVYIETDWLTLDDVFDGIFEDIKEHAVDFLEHCADNSGVGEYHLTLDDTITFLD